MTTSWEITSLLMGTASPPLLTLLLTGGYSIDGLSPRHRCWLFPGEFHAAHEIHQKMGMGKYLAGFLVHGLPRLAL
ncbi:MAG: hypothetical protein DMG06_07080, partial [Acidobacteria bacterium]